MLGKAVTWKLTPNPWLLCLPSWGLNPCHWATSPAVFPTPFFHFETVWLGCSGWPWTCNPPAISSPVAEVAGICCSTWLFQKILCARFLELKQALKTRQTSFLSLYPSWEGIVTVFKTDQKPDTVLHICSPNYWKGWIRRLSWAKECKASWDTLKNIINRLESVYLAASFSCPLILYFLCLGYVSFLCLSVFITPGPGLKSEI